MEKGQNRCKSLNRTNSRMLLVLDPGLDPVRKNESKGLSFSDFVHENRPNDSANITRYLHEFHLTPPSTKPYNLDAGVGKYSHSNIDGQLRNLFRNHSNGFFVEAGANDGQFLSNTLRLEIEQNWTGLLVEPNPFIVPALRLTNRRAWIADVCLSSVGHPVKIRFLHYLAGNVWTRGQGIIEDSPYNPQEGVCDIGGNYIYAGAVECFPLETLLLALNRTVVDYFAFDVEGIEYKVLRNFPFEQITIKVISIEHYLIPEGCAALEQLLISNNFKIALKTDQDIIAIHNHYVHSYKL